MTDQPLSGKVGLDVTDFKTGVAEMNRSIRVIESGFRATAAGLGDWSKSASGLETRIKALNSEIDIQKQKVAATEAEYKKMAAEKGENSRAAQNLEIRLNRENETLNKMQGELDRTEQSLKNVANEEKSAAREAGNMANKEKDAQRETKTLKDRLKDLQKGVKNVSNEFQNLGGKVLKGLAVGIAGVGVALAGLGSQIFVGFKSLERIERINSQTEAAIKSTGGAAGLTAKQVEDMSGKLEDLTATEAESTQEAANMLLTFTSIGKDVFPDALKTVVDMGRAFDKTGNPVIDMTQQAVMLGKALNVTEGDVTAASTALNAMRRVGVQFTTQQIEQAKQMVKVGDIAGYQRLVLDELQREFGGSGEAFAKTAKGQWELVMHQFGTFQEMLAGPFLNVAKTAFTKLNEIIRSPQVVGAIQNLTDHIQNIFDYLGKGNVKKALLEVFPKDVTNRILEIARTIQDFIQNTLIPFVQQHAEGIKAAIIAIGATLAAAGIAAAIAAIANPITLIIVLAGLLGAAWKENWGGIRDTLTQAWQTIQPALQQLWQWLQVNVPVALETLRNFWVGTAWPAIQNAIQTAWPIIQDIFAAVKDFILNQLVPTVKGLYQQWSTNWNTVQTVTQNVWTVISGIFAEIGRWVNDNIVPWIQYLQQVWAEEVWPGIQSALETVWAIIEPIWQSLKDWLEVNLPPALEGLQTIFENVMDGINQAIIPVKTLWDEFWQAVQDFWDWISSHTFNFKIHLPDLPEWALPGSPLPIHTAWKNFAQDMKQILPQINAGINSAGNAPVLAAGAGSSSAAGSPLVLENGAIQINAVLAKEMDMHVWARLIAEEIKNMRRA